MTRRQAQGSVARTSRRHCLFSAVELNQLRVRHRHFMLTVPELGKWDTVRLAFS